MIFYNMFFMNNNITETKPKKVTWNEKVYWYETFSNEDYDRTIDIETININIQNKIKKRLIRVPTNNNINNNQNVFNPYSLFSKFKGTQIQEPQSYSSITFARHYSVINPVETQITIPGAKSMLQGDPFGIELPIKYNTYNDTWRDIFHTNHTIPYTEYR